MNVRRGRKPDPVRREEILNAVADYVLEHGLAGIALRPLAEAIGGSTKVLMHHFGSKEQLLNEAVATIERRRRALYEALLEDGVAPQDVVLRGWELSTTPQSMEIERFRLHLLAFALDDPDRYAGFLETYNDETLELVKAGLAIDGVVDPHERVLMATVVRAVLRGLHLDLMASGDAARVEAAGFHYFADQLRVWMADMKVRGRMASSETDPRPRD